MDGSGAVDATNHNRSDIAHNISSDSIAENLEGAWKVALSNRSKVLALTVPEAGVKGSSMRARLDERRNKLNSLIKGFKRPN